ncbi:MAG: tetratricopeptide repeat protein, partial [Planctomycetes bacterium]|nr:tetratricopeptide repeat protein [Planctomycetota bacterium]
AIVQRCLAVNPDERYHNIEVMIEDLQQYQSGQVEIQKYSTVQLIGYWFKNHRLFVQCSAAIVLLLAIAGAVSYQVHLQERAGWGAAIYTENFDKADAWKKDWFYEFADSDFQVEDKKLVAKNGPEFLWFYNKRLHGGVAIEFEGTIRPGTTAGDLSIVYCSNIDAFTEDGRRPADIYYLQHGAVGNACSMIEGPGGRLDYVPSSLEHGKTYKIRGEVDGKKLRLFLDGILVSSYDLLFPLDSGYIGLYAYYEDKVFDDIKIYNRELPRVTNIITTGDLLLENNLFALAEERYRKISDLYPNTAIAEESRYKTGLCRYELGDVDAAFEIWGTMDKSEFAMQINFYRWEQLHEQGDYNELLRQMYAMYRGAGQQLQTQIREQWGIFIARIRYLGNDDLIREFLRFREVSFPQDQIFSLETFLALRMIAEPQKSLHMFPKQNVIVARALQEMGEYQKMMKEYSFMPSSMASGLLLTGQHERALEEYGYLKGVKYDALMALGKLDVAAE